MLRGLRNKQGRRETFFKWGLSCWRARLGLFAAVRCFPSPLHAIARQGHARVHPTKCSGTHTITYGHVSALAASCRGEMCSAHAHRSRGVMRNRGCLPQCITSQKYVCDFASPGTLAHVRFALPQHSNTAVEFEPAPAFATGYTAAPPPNHISHFSVKMHFHTPHSINQRQEEGDTGSPQDRSSWHHGTTGGWK